MKIAVIGLGTMGSPMAENLIKAGFELTVHNRTRSREEALEAARVGFQRKYEVYSAHGLQGADSELVDKVTGDLEALMEDTFIVGSPQECVEQLARYRELGFTQGSLRLFYPEMTQKDVLDHIELVGKKVLPAVHRL